jgi:hypothetical protein
MRGSGGFALCLGNPTGSRNPSLTEEQAQLGGMFLDVAHVVQQ